MTTRNQRLTRTGGLTSACLFQLSLALAGAATGKEISAAENDITGSKPKTLWVNKTEDSSDGVCDVDCSLREAITAAVAGDRIGFAPLFENSAQTISLTSGELLINKDLILSGPAKSLTISANSNSRVLRISNALVSISNVIIMQGRVHGSDMGAGILNEGELWLSRCGITDNLSEASGSGGGIANLGQLHVSDCKLDRNRAGRGGAIYSNGELMVKRSVLEENFATSGGAVFAGEAAIFGVVDIADTTIRNNSVSDEGGGLYLQASRSRVQRSTLHRNVARERGAAVFFGSPESYRALQLVNSTISQNTSGIEGAAIYSEASGDGGAFLEITNCTLAFNNALRGAGIFSHAGQGSIAQTTLRSSIVYANGMENFATEGFGEIASQGYNLSNDASIAFLNDLTDKLQSDPKLLPLANNGGPTWTHALAIDSAAIDQGKSFDLPSDQRGSKFERIVRLTDSPAYGGDHADIGAFESQTEK